MEPIDSGEVDNEEGDLITTTPRRGKIASDLEELWQTNPAEAKEVMAVLLEDDDTEVRLIASELG